VDELASFFRKAVDDYMVAESAAVLKTHSASWKSDCGSRRLRVAFKCKFIANFVCAHQEVLLLQVSCICDRRMPYNHENKFL
jgi:hypothetical protein